MENKEITPIIGLVLDFETGSLDPQKGAITQIAMHAVRIDTFEKLGSFIRYIKPYHQKKQAKKAKKLISKYDEEPKVLMDYTEKALEYSAITMDLLESKGEDIEQVASDLLAFIKDNTPDKCPANMKPFIIGQNIDFDEGFLSQLIEYGGIEKEIKKLIRGKLDYFGNWHPLTLDTIVLGQLALCRNPKINSYKLELMCEVLGIELEDAHDADADVTATTNVVKVITQRMRSVGGEIEGGELENIVVEKTRKHFLI